MAVKVCQNCGKGIMKGNKVTRARQELTYRSSRNFKPNLQTYRMPASDGTTQKITLCTKCLKMMKQYVAENVIVVKEKVEESK